MKKSKIISKKYKSFNFDFLANTTGSILIPFAIMLPTIFLCLSIGVNHAYTFKNKTALSEATNEAALALVALNNKNLTQENKERNKEVALNYINYYLTKDINSKIDDKSSININYNESEKEYYVYYTNDVEPLVKIENDNLTSSSITIANNIETYGNTRKTFLNTDTIDVAFVTDFSGSITCSYNDSNCNTYSSRQGDQRRLDYMRKAISELVESYSDKIGYKFALVPYDIGVPIENGKKNLAGGDSYSCSIPFKLKAPYNTVDYDFWADKYVQFSEWVSLKEAGIITDYLAFDYFAEHANSIFYYIDRNNYEYYRRVIGPSKGFNSDFDLVNNNLCIKRHSVPSTQHGEYKYGCGIERDDYALKQENLQKVEEQYPLLVKLYDFMYTDNNREYDTHYSFANTMTIDVDGTIKALFSNEKKSITFTRPIIPTMAEHTPFSAMCLSPIYSNKVMVGNDNELTYFNLYKNTSENIASFKNSPRLVKLTDGAELLNYIKSSEWLPGGGTDTMSGFLTSVPVLSEGEGNHKVIILMSDGKDDSGADRLRDEFVRRKVCKTIKDGFMNQDYEDKGFIAKKAASAAIHFIKLDPSVANMNQFSEQDYLREFGAWYECVGRDKNYLHVATDYESILDISKHIIESETGNFISTNKGE